MFFTESENSFRLSGAKRWLCLDRQARKLIPKKRGLARLAPFFAKSNQETI